MNITNSIPKLEIDSKNGSISKSYDSFEVVVIEDNQLTNTILSRALESAIKSIENLKNISVKLLSFNNGGKFLAHLENKDFSGIKLIVFTDYHLEDNMDGSIILKNIKKKKADATVIVMSDSSNEQIWLNAVKDGAYCFLPKSNKIPVVCSELLFQMVV